MRKVVNHIPLTISEAFDPRSNSIGFLRWLMAFLVIFSHAGPIGGFYGGEDLGVQISSEQSLGGVAVAGFFFFSGFLITRSRMGRSSIWRYLWRRCLRIFPAFWSALLLTVGVLAPIAWVYSGGTIHGYLHPDQESPLSYFFSNMWLHLGQRNIAGMGDELPDATLHGARDWNGSAWTLEYEFRAYLIVAVLGSCAAFANRRIGATFAIGMIVLNAMQWMGAGNMAAVNPLFGDIYNLMFFAPFCFGMLFALYGDKIPVDDRLAIAAFVFAAATYAVGGWNIIGQYGFAYFLMWLAIRLPLTNWEKHGDLSYGIYIYAWPLMTFAAYFGLQETGWLIYHLVIVAAVHVVAYLSWHLVEKPAMELKNWTPRMAIWAIRHLRPGYDAILHKLVVPKYSSSRYATEMLEASPKEGR
jgi:peptidoglycan/LPS O-acetylase OafA/YrhL